MGYGCWWPRLRSKPRASPGAGVAQELWVDAPGPGILGMVDMSPLMPPRSGGLMIVKAHDRKPIEYRAESGRMHAKNSCWYMVAICHWVSLRCVICWPPVAPLADSINLLSSPCCPWSQAQDHISRRNWSRFPLGSAFYWERQLAFLKFPELISSRKSKD